MDAFGGLLTGDEEGQAWDFHAGLAVFLVFSRLFLIMLRWGQKWYLCYDVLARR